MTILLEIELLNKKLKLVIVQEIREMKNERNIHEVEM